MKIRHLRLEIFQASFKKSAVLNKNYFSNISWKDLRNIR